MAAPFQVAASYGHSAAVELVEQAAAEHERFEAVETVVQQEVVEVDLQVALALSCDSSRTNEQIRRSQVCLWRVFSPQTFANEQKDDQPGPQAANRHPPADLWSRYQSCPSRDIDHLVYRFRLTYFETYHSNVAQKPASQLQLLFPRSPLNLYKKCDSVHNLS